MIFSLFVNSFTEVKFTWYTIHPFIMYNSVFFFFYCIGRHCKAIPIVIYRMFSTLKRNPKHTSCDFSSPFTPLCLENNKSNFCLSIFVYSGYFIQIKYVAFCVCLAKCILLSKMHSQFIHVQCMSTLHSFYFAE